MTMGELKRLLVAAAKHNYSNDNGVKRNTALDLSAVLQAINGDSNHLEYLAKR